MTYNESHLIKNLSRNVKKLMDEKKISMNELAKKTGLSFSVIRNIKEGKNKKLNAHNIYRLSLYFHISPQELLGTDSIPPELKITEEHVEFITSFFEKEACDFTYYNKCGLYKEYGSEYEECVVNSIHSFIEAHKIASGYYHEGINIEKTKAITKDSVEKEYREYVLNEFFQKHSKDNIEGDKKVVKDVEMKCFNTVSATGMAIKKLREFYGITRKELATRTGLGEDCMYRIESGINKKINYEHIQLIARELLCTSDFLLGESCDPTSNRDGSSLFYPIERELVFRYVQLGHDLSYALTYMDAESKEIVISMIHNLNTMYTYKKMNEDSFGKRLSVQEVFFREESRYMDTYKKRGAHFYTKRYSMSEGGENNGKS